MIHNPTLLAEIAALVTEIDTKNTDIFISVYGPERTGKSTFAINLAKALDPTFTAETLPKRTCLTFEDFAKVAPKIAPKQVVWWDEAGDVSKRSAYGGTINAVFLKYIQQAGGSRRIYIFCYPDLNEIDRKVTQRSRLFFETVKKNGQYWVRGWNPKQIDAKIREFRLPSANSRASVWAELAGEGLGKKPVSVFRCDYQGVEAEIEAYKVLKKINLERTDDFLASYAQLNQGEFAIQLQYELRSEFQLDYHKEYLRRLIQQATKDKIAEVGEEDAGVFKGARDMMYKNQSVIDEIKGKIKFKLTNNKLLLLDNKNIISNTTTPTVPNGTVRINHVGLSNEFSLSDKSDVSKA